MPSTYTLVKNLYNVSSIFGLLQKKPSPFDLYVNAPFSAMLDEEKKTSEVIKQCAVSSQEQATEKQSALFFRDVKLEAET